MPDQLYSLTFFELQSLHLHHIRQNRRAQYNAFLSAWYPNHAEGDSQPSIEAFWPLPGDPGWTPPGKKKGSLEEHIEMLREAGEGGPPEKD